MKKFVATAAVAAALCVASPAFGQDGPTPDTASSLAGFSIAVIGGVDALTIQENDAADATRDIMYGASAGYDFDAGSVVVGLQAEYSDSSASFEIDDLLVAGDQFTSAAGRNLYGGVRVGMRAGGNALVYVGGGYVDGKLTSRYTSGATVLEESETDGGFRVSLGGEVGRRNVFGRLELRYQDFGDYTVFGVPTGFARTHTQLVAGVGARF